ncbi:NuA4-domain-containing protein [Dendrothele bispora CBS 962.96]|uniref:Chromatin modification-related protein EAF6 n=1 Tax=Dendrothele bispora (strain CBS 962.96) TaxID=1314807 RepID=A0A4S8MM03_DENBC|nr:NuA4-domain-containing protein [Dendrothele bispora CBS 962.96]
MTDIEDDKVRHEALKRELVGALQKKRAMDKKLAHLEYQIFNLEQTYLNDTTAHSGGNLIQGFENYLKNQTTGRRRVETAENDRIFSNSSLTYQKSLDLMAEEEGTTTEDGSKQATSGMTTIALPPATRTTEPPPPNQNKLIRDREYSKKRRETLKLRQSAGTISDDETIPTSSRRATKRARVVDDE